MMPSRIEDDQRLCLSNPFPKGRSGFWGGWETQILQKKGEPEGRFIDHAGIVARVPAATLTTTNRYQDEEHFKRSAAAPPTAGQDAEVFIQGLI
jgi:hypothetical protein